MDTFEAARQKHAKNLQRRTKHEEVKEVPAVVTEVVPEALKEKPKHAFITVKVSLPDREMTLQLMKPNIYQNITSNRLTKSEIKKCVEDGFRSLLGGLDDVPGSS